MGITQVQAKILGEYEEREYTFLVEAGSNYVALPQEEIEALGLWPSGGTARLNSATRPVDVKTYNVVGELRGQRFAGVAVPSATPMLGYGLLQNLRYRVNTVTHDIEKVPDDEFYPPFLLQVSR